MDKILWYEAHAEIAKFAIPVLKDFYIRKSGFPAQLEIDMDGDCQRATERWDDILKDIIIALEHLIDDDWNPSTQESEKQQRSLELFGKWFIHLWD